MPGAQAPGDFQASLRDECLALKHQATLKRPYGTNAWRSSTRRLSGVPTGRMPGAQAPGDFQASLRDECLALKRQATFRAPGDFQASLRDECLALKHQATFKRPYGTNAWRSSTRRLPYGTNAWRSSTRQPSGVPTGRMPGAQAPGNPQASLRRMPGPYGTNAWRSSTRQPSGVPTGRLALKRQATFRRPYGTNAWRSSTRQLSGVPTGRMPGAQAPTRRLSGVPTGRMPGAQAPGDCQASLRGRGDLRRVAASEHKQAVHGLLRGPSLPSRRDG